MQPIYAWVWIVSRVCASRALPFTDGFRARRWIIEKSDHHGRWKRERKEKKSRVFLGSMSRLLRFWTTVNVKPRQLRTMFCCLRNCFDGLGFAATPTPKRERNPIALDTTHMGNCHRDDEHIGLINSMWLVRKKRAKRCLICIAFYSVYLFRNNLCKFF